VHAVYTQPLSTVIGPSGSGKSSVVFAGLVPQLRQEGNWLIHHFRPKGDPFYELSKLLVSHLAPNLSTIEQGQKAENLADALQQGKRTLPRIVSDILQAHPDRHLLLIADQFEELYTLCPEEQIRQHFIDELLLLVQATSERWLDCTIVLTVRADFYGHLLSYRPLRDVLQQFTPQLLSMMNQQELLNAIAKPAQQQGMQLEANLTQRILEDVRQEPGNLPLLEFAMQQLWQERQSLKLTHQAYGKIGGVKQALTRYAEQQYQQLTLTEQEQAQRIFLQLVHVGQGKEEARRIATRQEVGDRCWQLVTRKDGLADARLVVTGWDESKQEETVEIVHEALIHRWDRLQNWLKHDREFRLWQENLRVMLQQWQQNHRDQDMLLRGTSLLKAEDWLQQRSDDFSSDDRAFIQASQHARRISRLKTFAVALIIPVTIAALSGFFAFQQNQLKAKQAILALTPDAPTSPDQLPTAVQLLKDAETLKQRGNIDEALRYYRQVITYTLSLRQAAKQIPAGRSITPNCQANPSELTDQTFCQAESGLVQLIEEKRLPQLRSELQTQPSQPEGRNADAAPTEFDRLFPPGALKTTYFILRRDFGAKADTDDSGEIRSWAEADRLPCPTLKQIEKLWREVTNGECGWYSKSDYNTYRAPGCKRLGGRTLTAQVFNRPYDAAVDRLNQCQIAPVKLKW
jgi:tetratricopeptide (TPR) repeat protein